MDRAALFGNGTNEPLGLYGNSNVGLISPNANGFTPSDYDEFSSAIQQVEDADGAFERFQFKIRATLRYDIAVLRPKFFSTIKGIKA